MSKFWSYYFLKLFDSLPDLTLQQNSPEILEFRVSPTEIRRGERAVLSWRVANATRIYIDPFVGNLNGMTGSIEISPTENQRYLLVAENQSGTSQHSVNIVVRADQPTQNVGVSRYRVKTAEEAARFWSGDKKAYRDALVRGITHNLYRPEDVRNPGFDDKYTDQIDLKQIRPVKRYTNIMRALIQLSGDPAFITPVFNAIKPVLTNLDDRFRPWPSWLPIPDWMDNDRKYWLEVHGNTRDTIYIQNEKSGGTRFPSLGREYRGLKRINYLSSSISSDGKHSPGPGQWKTFGTHYHTLDNILAHNFVFWASFLIDVNRHINPEYRQIADIGYDYMINHWEVLMSRGYGRNNTTGVYRFTSPLYHNVAAHLQIYDCMVQWVEFREGRPRDIDVRARGNLMKALIDSLRLRQVPGSYTQVRNPSRYEFSTMGHVNQDYKRLIGASITSKDWGGADCTYDSEFGGDILNLYLSNVADINGRKLEQRHFAALSNTYGMVVEQPFRNGQFDWRMAEGISGSKTPVGNKRGTIFNDETKVETGMGGWAERYLTKKPIEGWNRRGMTGGLYHWADPTDEKYNIRRWLSRWKHNPHSGWAYTAQQVVANPTATKSAELWDWVGCLLINELLNPGLRFTSFQV